MHNAPMQFYHFRENGKSDFQTARTNCQAIWLSISKRHSLMESLNSFLVHSIIVLDREGTKQLSNRVSLSRLELDQLFHVISTS